MQALICTTRPSSPIELLSSAALGDLIGQLRERFDVILIDTPPLLPVNDTKIIAQQADSMVMAVRWEKTPQGAVASALRLVAEIGTSLTGIVLMRANDERFRYYAYGSRTNKEYEAYYRA